MTWHLLDPLTVYRAACKACSTLLEDTDADRLHAEMALHQLECPCRS